MRPGWNPTRRNRHAGTGAHGHGQDNRHVIPESWHSVTRFYEVLGKYVVVTRPVGTRELPFLVEPTRPGWFYPCTIDDACAVLAHLPEEDLRTVDMVVLRQPTRRQRVLSPVWGRALFLFDIDRFSGPAIVLEAQSMRPVKWPAGPSVERVRELDRLRRDGHRIEKTRRGIVIHPSREALRNTVLYRTLIHEVGHHVDAGRLTDAQWDCKSRTAKEDFAHRYAATQVDRLRQAALVPFDPVAGADAMLRDKLSPEWFDAGSAPPVDEDGPGE
jgi:hypothetical protein